MVLGYSKEPIPENTAILVTHGAPLGTLDANAKGEHLGDPTLAAALRQLAPRVHIFGHIHESYGTYENYGTRFVNASSCNRRKGFPSERQVRRGHRIVHGNKELSEKLGRNDLCPCGSGRRFEEVLHALWPV